MDDSNKPVSKTEADELMRSIIGEMTGRRGAPEGGTPALAAPSLPTPPEGDGHPVLDEAREIEARRDQEAEEVRLGRLFLEEKGGLPESVVAALTDNEVRRAAGLSGDPLSIDADGGDPAANAQQAVKAPGGSPLMSPEERQRRREAEELTVDPGVVRYREQREGA